ncbi:putative transcriptional regulator [Methylobacterium sp. OAE515]|uniref:MucR family transcriptional regulator n=1 Tax=Methylobacterium sp. OAE515 TaxID=2817895 RepID=UPI001789F678
MSVTPDFINLTAGIVAAYVSRQPVAAADLPRLMRRVHEGLVALQKPAAVAGIPAATAPAIERPTPVQIRKSIRDEGLTSFIDGRSYKTLKRHLNAHGLTPERYRERYGLPEDYPMTAPGYAAQRSALAKAIGLGVPGAQAKRQAAE